MISKSWFKILFLFLFVFVYVGATAQQFNEKQVQLIDGKTYYLHKVEKGNTLYSLSKMYSIKTKDLLNENPQLEEGLKIGQVIRIPIKKIDTKISGQNPPEARGELLFHEVLPKETLYSLCRKYNVEQMDLEKLNPELKDGLKIGMELKVPLPKETTKEITAELLAPAQVDSFTLHLVEPKETLYSLAVEYDVNIDSIRLINGGLKDGLKLGTTVRIPISKNLKYDLESFLNNSNSSDSLGLILDSGELKTKYLVSLLLPFYLDSNDSLSHVKLQYENEEMFRQSIVGMEFYTGFKMAVENMKLENSKIEIQVFDISMNPYSKSTWDMEQLTKGTKLFESDLIIGPFHRSNFLLASEYAKSIKRPIVSPVPQRNDILKDNPYAIKVYSSQEAQVDFMRAYTMQNWKEKNLILIENDEMRDVILSERFQGINNKDTNVEMYAEFNSSIKRIKMSEFDFKIIENYMVDSLNNILLMPMTNKTFVSRFLTGINRYSNKFKIKVVGLDSWNNMGYIDYRYLNNLEVHTTRNQFINYNDSTIEDFILVYRNTYGTEPNEWTFLGYDIANYFLQALVKDGTAFQNFFALNQSRGLSRSFSFKRVANLNGFENKGLRMVKIENYYFTELKE